MLAKIANDPGTEVLAHYHATNSLMILGDLDQAHYQALAGLETAERLRHRDLLNAALTQCGVVTLLKGELIAAREFTDRVQATSPRYPGLLFFRAKLEYEEEYFEHGFSPEHKPDLLDGLDLVQTPGITFQEDDLECARSAYFSSPLTGVSTTSSDHHLDGTHTKVNNSIPKPNLTWTPILLPAGFTLVLV